MANCTRSILPPTRTPTLTPAVVSAPADTVPDDRRGRQKLSPTETPRRGPGQDGANVQRHSALADSRAVDYCMQVHCRLRDHTGGGGDSVSRMRYESGLGSEDQVRRFNCDANEKHDDARAETEDERDEGVDAGKARDEAGGAERALCTACNAEEGTEEVYCAAGGGNNGSGNGAGETQAGRQCDGGAQLARATGGNTSRKEQTDGKRSEAAPILACDGDSGETQTDGDDKAETRDKAHYMSLSSFISDDETQSLTSILGAVYEEARIPVDCGEKTPVVGGTLRPWGCPWQPFALPQPHIAPANASTSARA